MGSDGGLSSLGSYDPCARFALRFRESRASLGYPQQIRSKVACGASCLTPNGADAPVVAITEMGRAAHSWALGAQEIRHLEPQIAQMAQ